MGDGYVSMTSLRSLQNMRRLIGRRRLAQYKKRGEEEKELEAANNKVKEVQQQLDGVQKQLNNSRKRNDSSKQTTEIYKIEQVDLVEANKRVNRNVNR